MLHFDEDERPSFIELKDSLPNWEKIQPFLSDYENKKDLN